MLMTNRTGMSVPIRLSNKSMLSSFLVIGASLKSCRGAIEKLADEHNKGAQPAEIKTLRGVKGKLVKFSKSY